MTSQMSKASTLLCSWMTVLSFLTFWRVTSHIFRKSFFHHCCFLWVFEDLLAERLPVEFHQICGQCSATTWLSLFLASAFSKLVLGSEFLAASWEELLFVQELFFDTEFLLLCRPIFPLITLTEQPGIEPHNKMFAQILTPCPVTRPPSDTDL